jgi:hypothetical protein
MKLLKLLNSGASINGQETLRVSTGKHNVRSARTVRHPLMKAESCVKFFSRLGTSGAETRQGAEVMRPRAVTTTH